MLSYAGCTKVVDFGIDDVERLRREADLSPAQAQFAAPELLAGGPVDGRADGYAAAVVLYTLLTLRYPYDAHRSVAAVMQAKQQRGPVPPSARSAEVPVELERLLLRALAADPRQRPASAEALGLELESFLAHAAAPASAASLAGFLAALFGARVDAKRSALRALLSMPAGEVLPGNTTVEVVAPDADGRAYTEIFVAPADPTTDVQLAPFGDEDPAAFDGPPTAPEVDPQRAPRDARASGPDFADATDPDAAGGEEDEDTAVRRTP
jgi:hypothetical protein